MEVANELNIPVTKGMVHSSRDEHGCIAVEMESFALFHNAKVLGKKAACLLTISDNLVTMQETSADERQNAFTRMMDIALGLAE